MGCQDCEGVSRNGSDEQSQCTHVRPEVAELIRGFDAVVIESVSFHRDCLRILLCLMPSIFHLEESAFRLCFDIRSHSAAVDIGLPVWHAGDGGRGSAATTVGRECVACVV